MTMRLFLVLVLLTATALCPAAHAEETGPAEMMAFADHLFDKADYYRAITEYERVAFRFPGHPLAVTARYRIALSYFRGNKLIPAIEQFRTLAVSYRTEQTGRDSLYMLGEAYYLNKDFPASREAFSSFVQTYPDDQRCDSARIRTGWAYLREGNWQGAEAAFKSLPPDSPLQSSAAGLAEGARNYPDIQKKSPALAGTMSAILPGAGQLYTDRPGDAVTSFLLNGVFIWGAIEAFRHDNDVTGGILVFFEAGWYAGNIYNAVSNAHKYNRKAERTYLERLENQYTLSLSRSPEGANVLAVHLRF